MSPRTSTSSCCSTISNVQIFINFPEGLVSYIIPKNIQRSNDIEHSDKTYDGDDEGDRMVNGLGQLVDGQKGTDNFRADVNGFGKGEWEKTWNVSSFVVGNLMQDGKLAGFSEACLSSILTWK